jgi:hypothetical protein
VYEKCLRDKFQSLKNNVHLYEAYTEFWAEMWNIAFISFSQHSTNLRRFEAKMKELLKTEIRHSLQQCKKVLTYNEFPSYSALFDNQYIFRENTNIFAYYIAKTILLFYYKKFVNWCIQTNGNKIYMFRQSPETIQNFCSFIKENSDIGEYVDKMRPNGSKHMRMTYHSIH